MNGPGLEPAASDGAKGFVFIVDDDASVRRGLGTLFRSAGLKVEAFGSAAEMAQSPLSEQVNCLVLDVKMPAVDGLELQEQLARSNRHTPIIFLSGHADVAISVQAMKAGAVDFFTKPVDGRAILDAVSAAIDRDRLRRARDNVCQAQRTDYGTLTSREREVMALATSGLMNKQIAAKLGLREITVKLHRASVMRKMRARTFADLVRMADSLQIRPPGP